jgi:hypothetical protein
MPARGTSTVGTAAYIQQRCRITPSGCVEWASTLSEDGYGKAVVGYRGHARPVRRYAHILTYEMWVGPVPPGLELDHLCRNRACVNPAHLEPVTRKVNVERGALPRLMRDPSFRPEPKALLEFCKHGHPMTGDNVGRNEKRRWCRACKRAVSQKRRAA